MDPYIGELRIFPYGFVPKGWAACDGTLLPINTNQALFALLGVQFGGNGSTTFALPDLRGRVPMHVSQKYQQGKPGGAAGSTLVLANVPAHNHSLIANTSTADKPTPVGNMLATTPAAVPLYAPAPGQASQLSAMAGPAISSTGASTPVNNIQPFTGLDVCIALVGIYPPRG
ncbi:phage tail protein [Mucilaginibacter mali]|nr:tail fiber protein [Mucilaginibacter mali]